MSLSAHEQQELDLIEDEIAGSDPALASLLATFTRLARLHLERLRELAAVLDDLVNHPDGGTAPGRPAHS